MRSHVSACLKLLAVIVLLGDGFVVRHRARNLPTRARRSTARHMADSAKNSAMVVLTSQILSLFLGASWSSAWAEEGLKSQLTTQLEDFAEKTEFENYKRAKEPKYMVKGIKDRLGSFTGAGVADTKSVDMAMDKVLTLKAYLDEAERDLFAKNWDNLQVYLYTFAEQEEAFALLIDQLFPTNDALDSYERGALKFEAQSMFVSLDDLREAAKDANFKSAQKAYSKLLLSYDRFLKAGNLYPTYDAITSTEIFFTNTPSSTLQFDLTARVQVLDLVVLTSGPDMGKTGTVIYVDGDSAVVKLDKDGKAYQEVKYVKYGILAKVQVQKKDKGGGGRSGVSNSGGVSGVSGVSGSSGSGGSKGTAG
ncbi:hypothetical protein B484DRAFT_447753 [Ochromonadaceae sp. CCMP2298]|nr:hypothetical protein B484DRAFT_447753 [Ochromonadaceae sp. CCMP2298]